MFVVIWARVTPHRHLFVDPSFPLSISHIRYPSSPCWIKMPLVILLGIIYIYINCQHTTFPRGQQVHRSYYREVKSILHPISYKPLGFNRLFQHVSPGSGLVSRTRLIKLAFDIWGHSIIQFLLPLSIFIIADTESCFASLSSFIFFKLSEK